jgi:hypothetical protein
VPADSPIKSLRDLEGKAIALPPRGNTSLAESPLEGALVEPLASAVHVWSMVAPREDAKAVLRP